MRIAIWGAGKFGKYVYEQYKEKSDVEVKCFFDSNPDIEGQRINNIPIVNIDKLEQIGTDLDCVLIAFMTGIDQLLSEINKYKNCRFAIVKSYVYKERKNLSTNLKDETTIIYIGDKAVLKYMETNTIDICNFSCKGCSHFSNLFSESETDNFDTFCKDLQQITNNVYIFEFGFVGGEPLLKKGLCEYLAFARKTLPNTIIRITTNGVLLLKQNNEFFDCCRENQIEIWISNYQPTKKLIDKIIEKLDSEKICYHVMQDKGDFGKNLTLNADADKDEAMKNCRQNQCRFLRNGKLYKCPFEALSYKFFEHFGLDIRIKGGMDIYDEITNWKKAIYELEKRPVDACKYCGKEKKFTWEHTKNPQEKDWTIS